MPKFKCVHAYQIPHYAEFTVEADSREQANAIVQEALAAGKFNDVAGLPYYDGVSNQQVWVDEEQKGIENSGFLTMEQLFKVADSY